MKTSLVGFETTDRKWRMLCFTSLVLAGVMLFCFLTRPSIDFDEGFFFQSAVHAVNNGVPGFPWSDVFFKERLPYIPLNSLLPLINWPLAYLPQSMWLFCARFVSFAAVLAGLSVMVFADRFQGTKSFGRYPLTGFVIFCLPLWFHGRQVRPEAILFFFFSGALVLILSDTIRSVWLAGVLGGLCLLSHAVHGVLIVALLIACAGMAVETTAQVRYKRIAAVLAGTVVPLVAFYGWYFGRLGVGEVWRQVLLFLAFTPRNVLSHNPYEHLVAWLSYLRGQLNLLPLLGVAIIALIAPLSQDKEEARIARTLKIATFLFLLFWVFVYPKKAFSPAVFLVPIVFVVLIRAPVDGWRGKLIVVGLWLCLAANLALSTRYHVRLVRSRSALQEIDPIVSTLRQNGAIRANARVMGKLWLVFGVPRDVVIWDITVCGSAMRKMGMQEQDLLAVFTPTDAVVTESKGGQFIDEQQREIAELCRSRSWREVKVSTTHYFEPLDLVIFLPPTSSVADKTSSAIAQK